MNSARSFGYVLEQMSGLCQELAMEHNREVAALSANLASAEQHFHPVSVGNIDLAVASAASPIAHPNAMGSMEEHECSEVPPQLASLETVVKAWHVEAAPKQHLRIITGSLAQVNAKCANDSQGQDEGTSIQRPDPWQALSLSVKKEKILEALHDRAHEVKQLSLETFRVRDIWSKDEDALLRIKRKARSENAQERRSLRGTTMIGFGWDWFMIHPQSNTRLVWDLAGILWLAFDVVVLPIQVFPLPDVLFLHVMDYLGNLFWTADIGASFITGTYSKSIPVMEFKAVAQHYARSWLAFDIFLVVIGWGSIVMDSMEAMNSWQVARAARTARFFRILRYLRLVRLLRVVKSVRFVDEIQARANSESSLFALGVLKLMAAVVLMSHILACCWYGVGDVPDGWVRTEITHNQTGIQEWDVGDQYLYTYQWSLSRLHPSTIEKNLLLRTTNERIFAMIGGLCAMAVGAGFISLITNMLREFQEKRKRRTHNLTLVQAYVLKYAISPPVAIRAKRYFEFEHEAKLRSQREAELMTILPHDMVLDFRYEAFSPITSKHDFFAELHRKHLRTHYAVCRGLSAAMILSGEVVFTTGDACGTMRFVTSGDFFYAVGMEKDKPAPSGQKGPEHEREDHVRYVKVGTALSEAVLWTPWEHRGELYSENGGAVLVVLAEEFAAVLREHEQALVAAAIHARCFVEDLNTTPVSELSDLPSCVDGGNLPEIPGGDEVGGIMTQVKSLLMTKSRTNVSENQGDADRKQRYPEGFHD